MTALITGVIMNAYIESSFYLEEAVRKRCDPVYNEDTVKCSIVTTELVEIPIVNSAR